MISSTSWRRLSRKSAVTIVATIILSFLALIYFLPRESKFGYVYEQNKPWRYTQLIASYDFPIQKTAEEIVRERDSVKRNFLPYYKTDTAIAARQIQALRKDFLSGKFKGVPGYYLPRLIELFKKVYATGIINSDDLDTFGKNKTQEVRLVKGKQSAVTPVTDFYTVRSAYDFLMQRDHGSLPDGILRQCNLNNYLMPNLAADAAKNKSELEDELGQLLTNCGMVQSGQLIIDRGQIVSAEHL